MNTETKSAVALGLTTFLLVTGCSADDSAPDPAGIAAPEDEPPAESEVDEGGGGFAVLNTVWDDRFGDVLTDGDGNILYMFTDDGPNTTSCVGECVEIWPPLRADGEDAPITASGAATADLVGSIPREDGEPQLTYSQWPLYTYTGDVSPGDVNGQGVGGAWYVLSPAGEMITGARIETGAGADTGDTSGGGGSEAEGTDDSGTGDGDDSGSGYGYGGDYRKMPAARLTSPDAPALSGL